MKKFYITLFLIALVVTGFSQPYFIYSAKKSGYWYDSGNWNVQPRLDGGTKHQVIIPASFTIIVDNNVNNLGLGDVEVFVSGGLNIVPNTTLNLTSNSSIELNNGVISGNANNQQILIGSVIKYKGDIDGLKTGNSIADNTTGVSPLGFRSLMILPVNFTSFYVTKSGESILLNWSTNKEINHSHFEIEKSLDGLHWQKLAIVAVAENNHSTNYNYHDKTSSTPVVFYRLRQVDIDGRFVYSSIKKIRMDQILPVVRVYGSSNNLVIDLNSIKDNLVVTIVNSNGQLIFKKVHNTASYKINLAPGNISAGVYMVKLSDNKGWMEVKKVVLK
jgi:hypothetical protein